MVPFTEIFLWFVLLFLLGAVYWYKSIPKNLPPGPIGLPFIGSSLEFFDATKQHLILQENVKKYGPIFKLYIGNKLVVVLGDYDSIQEGMIKHGDVLAGRPQLFGGLPEQLMGHGIVISEGDLWKEQRRFALSTLRDFGVGRPIIEPKIKEEIEFLVEQFSDQASTGLPIDPQRLITSAVSNIICQLIFGRRFDYNDTEFMRQCLEMSNRASGTGVSFLTPFVLSKTFAHLVGIFLPMGRRMKKSTDDFVDYVESLSKCTKSTYDPDSEPTNYIHAFMKAAANEKQEDTYFTDIQLLATLNDLFSAGTETTSSTMRWAILFLAHNQEAQEKLYQEIRREVGVNVLPSYADRTKLPFAEAVVMETQRLANLVPLGVFRRSLAPTKLMGYNIPEDTYVLPLLTNVLHNPDLYPDPHQFRPDRFIDSNGKVIRDPKLIPFQAGKRVCLGEPLARMELFLILVGLVSRLRFYFRSDQAIPTLEPQVGFTTTPFSYEVSVDVRE